MTAVVSKYYKGISAERRKKEFFKAVGFEPRQVKDSINSLSITSSITAP